MSEVLYTEWLRMFKDMALTCTIPFMFPVQKTVIIVINSFELWILLLL
jgi:hypothetical protein